MLDLFGNIKEWSCDTGFTQVSNVSAYHKNSNKIYTCNNEQCPFGTRKYLPKNKRYPNFLYCPLCNTKMFRNDLLGERISIIDNTIRKLGAANPTAYNLAKESFVFFAIMLDAATDMIWPYEVCSLNYLLDIAPKINDIEAIAHITKFSSKINFVQYNNIETILSTHIPLSSFISQSITTAPQRQVDLCKILKPILPESGHPNYTDPTWYFYVWRQFGIVKCEKIGRYNYIYK